MVCVAKGYWIGKIPLAASVLYLAGCVTAPPLPDFDPGQIENVGVHISSIGDPTHTHIGTTVFNNFEVPYEQDWVLAEEFGAVIGAALEAKGLNAVELSEIGLTAEDVEDSITRSGMGWQAAKPDMLAKLERAGLSAVVMVQPMEHLLAMQNCTMYGCADHFARGYGIFSRGVFGNVNYFTAFAFDVTATLVQPPSLITQSAPLQHLRSFKNKSRPWSHAPPADLQNLGDAEWEHLREDMIEQMNEFAEAIASVLAGEKTD